MLKNLTIESVTVVERGTNMIDDIYCTITFKELSEAIPFWACRTSKDEFSTAMWQKLDNGDYGEVGFPPTHYPSHPQTEAEKDAEVRAARDDALLKTDWTQSSDDLATAKKAEYKTYRSALRDIPLQVGFPFDVTWPTKP